MAGFALCQFLSRKHKMAFKQPDITVIVRDFRIPSDPKIENMAFYSV
jgi:hypothetical protein